MAPIPQPRGTAKNRSGRVDDICEPYLNLPDCQDAPRIALTGRAIDLLEVKGNIIHGPAVEALSLPLAQ